MKAEEMFESLGFRKNKSACYNNGHILYEKPVMNGTDIFTVEFKDGYVVYTDLCMRCIKMSVELLKAINKQCEELGWIE